MPIKFLVAVGLVFLVCLIPLSQCESLAGCFTSMLFLLTTCFAGYLLVGCFGRLNDELRLLISPVFGIGALATTYELSSEGFRQSTFKYAFVAAGLAGAAMFIWHLCKRQISFDRRSIDTYVAGAFTTLFIGPLFWRSGRFSGDNFVIFGPAGQDHLYHVTLIQRLFQHIPPDNFIVSGFRPPVYHYFDDLTLASILRMQNLGLHSDISHLMDLYYRGYPTLIYFLIGALAYYIGHQLTGVMKGGVLGVFLLLGSGGLGWAFGLMQTVIHFRQLGQLRERLFADWASWDGVDSVYPLVHRPANYHGLLMSLAALAILLHPASKNREWCLAGLIVGMMAGFNFTLAAIFGVSISIAWLYTFVSRRSEAANLAGLGLFTLLGSLPILSAMVLSGFHNNAPGFPFRGPNLEFPISIWGATLHHMLPQTLVPMASLLMFSVICYGIKLTGLKPMLKADLGKDHNRAVALVLMIVFLISFLIGVFFPYQGFGGIAIVFLQPTLWILGLFALQPVCFWMERNKGTHYPIIVWIVLAMVFIQALVAFNFSYKLSLDRRSFNALRDLRDNARVDDVVAFWPTSIALAPILGTPDEATSFAVTALTGLDGYFSSQTYSEYFAVPGLSGRDSQDILSQAEHIYIGRSRQLGDFVRGTITATDTNQLIQNRVRWIVVPKKVIPEISTTARPWRETENMVIFQLSDEAKETKGSSATIP